MNLTIVYISLQRFFFKTIFVSSHIYPENLERTQVIVGSMNMGYISDTARNRTRNLFRSKRESIPLGHSDGWPTLGSYELIAELLIMKFGGYEQNLCQKSGGIEK